MEQIRIAVYDSDAAYTERFCGYMGEVPERAEVFYPVYEKQALDDMIAGRQVDAVLVPEESRKEYPPFIGDIHVGYFTSQPDTAAGKVFRYQSRRNLFQSIELLFSQEDTAVKMVVFSGAGTHTGCSAAAGAMQSIWRPGSRRFFIQSEQPGRWYDDLSGRESQRSSDALGASDPGG